MEDKDVVESEEVWSQRTAVFHVKDSVLDYVRSLGMHHCDLQVKQLKCMSAAECAIHF